MKKFLLLLHEDTEAMNEASEEDFQQLVEAHGAWAEKLGESGHLLSGDGLDETGVQLTGADSTVTNEAVVVNNSRIGGFYLIQAENLEAAVELSKGCPGHLYGGTTEIRPIMDYEEE